MKLFILIISLLAGASAYSQTMSTDSLECKEYTKLIKAADARFLEHNFEKSLEYYKRAVLLKPSDQYPKQKVAECEAILAEQRADETEAQFTQLIATADSCFAQKDFQNAKSSYENALKLKPSESYPLQKIMEIDGILQHQSQ